MCISCIHNHRFIEFNPWLSFYNGETKALESKGTCTCSRRGTQPGFLEVSLGLFLLIHRASYIPRQYPGFAGSQNTVGVHEALLLPENLDTFLIISAEAKHC